MSINKNITIMNDNINNAIQINMPKGCRYMSDYDKLLDGILPLDRKFILNKTVTGCGGTSLFLNSNFPVVIISPRLQVLKEKHKQYPDSFHFHIPPSNNRGQAIIQKMQDLDSYLNYHHGSTPFAPLSKPAKILVTLDSSDKVLGVLRRNNMLDSCLFVVDEFQCLMGDATFKGSTDMNFLIRLDSEVKRICYLSATPVPDIYLDYIPQFASIPYYKLEWDPDVIVEPTLKERQMRKGETAEKLCEELIQRYRRDGYFERKIVNGNITYSREACIFLNEVKSIIRIIRQNNLKPDEVTILCSESQSSKLPKGFTTGGLNTDRNKPRNKPFTFCTKSSFEGVDFYSDNASTYIFINAGKEWQTLDIMLDIPQILGRQRLDTNPFRHDATIYYKTYPAIMTEAEFGQKQKTMDLKTNNILNVFNSAPEEYRTVLMDSYRKMEPDKKFTDDYTDLIQENGQTTIGYNHLVMAAMWNRWYQRNCYYNNSCQLLTSIQSAVGMRKKPDEMKQFEEWYYNAPDKDRLAGYANFRNQCPQYDTLLLQNPFIDFRFHGWYGTLGYDTLSSLGFREADVEDAYSVLCAQAPISEACRQEFVPGMLYSKQEVKVKLQKIYDSLGLSGKTAKATDLKQYLPVVEKQRTNDRGRKVCLILI